MQLLIPFHLQGLTKLGILVITLPNDSDRNSRVRLWNKTTNIKKPQSLGNVGCVKVESRKQNMFNYTITGFLSMSTLQGHFFYHILNPVLCSIHRVFATITIINSLMAKFDFFIKILHLRCASMTICYPILSSVINVT